MILADFPPPATNLATDGFGVMVFVFVQTEEQHGSKATHHDLELQQQAIAIDPVVDLLQGCGQSTRVTRPLSGQSISGAFAAAADEEGNELGEEADHCKDQEREEETSEAYSRSCEVLLAFLHLVRELVDEQAVFVADEGRAENPGHAAGQENGKERTHGGGERSDGDVAALHVGKLVGQNGFQFFVAEVDSEQAFCAGDERVAG